MVFGLVWLEHASSKTFRKVPDWPTPSRWLHNSIDSPGFQLLKRHAFLTAGLQLNLAAILDVGAVMGETVVLDDAK